MDWETDGVVPNLLCKSCSRIVGESEIIQQFIDTRSDELSDIKVGKGPANKKPEVFFHSQSLETIMSSAAFGCHLCSIVSWDESKYFRHKDQSAPEIMSWWGTVFRYNDQRERGAAPATERSDGIIQISVTRAWTNGQPIMSFDIMTDVQASARQMEDEDEMDAILNQRYLDLQGWERWRSGRSLSVISLRKANGTPTASLLCSHC